MIFFVCSTAIVSLAQNIAINTDGAAANASAILDISSTTNGILIPRVTFAQKTAIASPVNGLLVYQTDASVGLWYYDSSLGSWIQMGWSPPSSWQTSGNGLSGNEWVGASNAADVIIKTNNTEKIRIESAGNIGIGQTPTSLLDVKGNLNISGSASGYVGLAVPAVAGSTTYTLPSGTGQYGYFLLTNGAGGLSWERQNNIVGASYTDGNVELAEEFIGYFASGFNLGWAGRASGGTVSDQSGSELHHPGVIKMTNTGVNSYTSVYLGLATTGFDFIFGNQPNMTIKCSIKEGTVSGAGGSTNDFNRYFGMGRDWYTSSTAEPSYGVYFRTVANGNWFAVTRDAGVETATDTGIAPAAGTWRKLKIVTNSTGTSINFYVDGVLKATHTTNITASAGDVGFRMTGGAAHTTSAHILIDYFHLLITGLSR